ncbi:sulfurtransferase [Occultella kanbiaonis]|uniref:sulfurtransferase n=1 Tax=Occultella kanbiaonis TaxID=2675754 RepID=UPI003F498AFD
MSTFDSDAVSSSANGASRATVLITAQRLQELLGADGGTHLVVLDVRWSLAEPDGRRFYIAGHIPGAQYVDLDADLSGPAAPETGRHPLPDVADLQAAARSWGVGAGDTVVVYDDSGGTAAARAWWLLRWGGIADVRILDGGLAAWHTIGGILEDGAVGVTPGDVTLTAGGMPVADAARVAELAGRPDGGAAVLLDARAPERYSGENEPIDPRAGHIPGAHNAPTVANLTEDLTFRPAEQLRERFAEAGVGPDVEVVVYCGSGVTAAHEVAALASIGVPATLYPGSWSQWSADAARPVATGFDPRPPSAESPGRPE